MEMNKTNETMKLQHNGQSVDPVVLSRKRRPKWPDSRGSHIGVQVEIDTGKVVGLVVENRDFYGYVLQYRQPYRVMPVNPNAPQPLHILTA